MAAKLLLWTNLILNVIDATKVLMCETGGQAGGECVPAFWDASFYHLSATEIWLKKIKQREESNNEVWHYWDENSFGRDGDDLIDVMMAYIDYFAKTNWDVDHMAESQSQVQAYINQINRALQEPKHYEQQILQIISNYKAVQERLRIYVARIHSFDPNSKSIEFSDSDPRIEDTFTVQYKNMNKELQKAADIHAGLKVNWNTGFLNNFLYLVYDYDYKDKSHGFKIIKGDRDWDTSMKYSADPERKYCHAYVYPNKVSAKKSAEMVRQKIKDFKTKPYQQLLEERRVKVGWKPLKDEKNKKQGSEQNKGIPNAHEEFYDRYDYRDTLYQRGNDNLWTDYFMIIVTGIVICTICCTVCGLLICIGCLFFSSKDRTKTRSRFDRVIEI